MAEARPPEDAALPAYAGLYWRAWQALQSEHPVVMGAVLPLPFRALDAYAARHGIEDFATFERLLTAMDDEYMATLPKPTEATPE